MPKRSCNSCQSKDTHLKCCSQCKLVDYCSRECQLIDWKNGHKILCVKAPKAVEKAKAKMDSFRLHDYTTRNVGAFMVTRAQAERGQIVEEEAAMDMCYDAMEMKEGSSEKLQQILMALNHFPLSVEAWGMLGRFYRWETKSNEIKTKECSLIALRMYENAVICARKLNRTWTEDRKEELSWGEIDNRPYLRAVSGRAQTLKDVGRKSEAIVQAKKLLRWNPTDNQGVRQLLSSWYLETGDTEGCTNLLRKYEKNICTSLSYSDVLLQFLRWKKDDAVENDVKRPLYAALKSNPFVPDLITVAKMEKKLHQYISPGGINEAESYAYDARRVWRMHPESVEWLRAQKSQGMDVPEEQDLVDLLKSGKTFLMKCTHTDLNGNDKITSIVEGTQRRSKCYGCGVADFFWPRQLNQPHQTSADIFFHDNDKNDKYQFETKNDRWRRTRYCDVIEVPYWKILLQFYQEDESSSDESSSDEEEIVVKKVKKKSYNPCAALSCNECGSPGTNFCAVGNGGITFYCSEECMNDKLLESGLETELSFDLNSNVLNISVSYETSLRTLDLDDIFLVAVNHMPNLIAVDFFISQDYFNMNDDIDFFSMDQDSKKLILSSQALRSFLEKVSTKLESFSFSLGDCCKQQFKGMSDGGNALRPLGMMPKLRKLKLSRMSFDDINVLTSCLNPKLKVLHLDNISMREGYCFIAFEVQSLVAKISQMKDVVSLSLDDNSLTDEDLAVLLPQLKFLRCLSVSGRFGDTVGGRSSLISNVGLGTIARCCPRLQSLAINHQKRISSTGIRKALQIFQELLEFEISDITISTFEVKEFLAMSKKLLYFLFDNKVGGVPAQEKRLIQDAVKVAKGRTLVGSFYQGVYEFNLSQELQRNQNVSREAIERSWEQNFDPKIYNKWENVRPT